MPRIFDNIEQDLLPALVKTLAVSERADFCVGYFNLRGWKQLDRHIEPWAGGEGRCCRLLVGMQRTPQEELQQAFRLTETDADAGIDNSRAKQLKRKLADEFRRQLMLGAPTNEDEAGLRRLARQLRAKKLSVKLHLRHTLHAKLYLLFRDDYNNPISGYLGSSNLTFAGLTGQGELNVDVLDHDACQKLARWFDDRWDDRFCIDISAELIEVIEESWAAQQPTPYEIYLKMAYHLALEARAGLGEFSLPAEFRTRLFKFQAEAVRIAARYLNRQGGVIIGDVVGLGKTLMAAALAKIFEDDQGVSTLILCPVNLVKMWQGYVDTYGLRARVMPSSMAIKQLPDVPARFRQVIIDESHNFRNREGKTYRAIKEYLDQSDSRCILLSAIRPERLLRETDPADSIQAYETEHCGNLYTLVVERSFSLLNQDGRLGMIVPMSIVSAERMAEIKHKLFKELGVSFFNNGQCRRSTPVTHKRLMTDYQTNSQRRKIQYRTGWIEYDEFYPRLSKPLVDEIDRVLAEHYSFTDDELDFILN
jgi:PLD-like domain